MDISQTLIYGFGIFQQVLFLGIALAGVVGAIFAGTTRDDAYAAADRQSKLMWVAILVGSALVVATGVPFLSWVGIVAIGVFWFDVLPHLRRIISGAGGW
ncbi:hypothetical protein CATRI_01465 [Corynebacterium atrinae]|uniref:DUF2516 family protein n=1 Tax=Corynebacterium atrinae TaxID=1336740 RepID=UPI0025B4AE7F|nr:DUF2516 family protein [Corynebacterium atrinae]WJY62406.1 hypothetical protein CATRI_01465 [Corynebacterium atrinae]